MARENGYLSNGDNEEKAAEPDQLEETVEGGKPVEDSPLIPGGATADTKDNIADPDDAPAGN